jgi:hypothetical protein
MAGADGALTRHGAADPSRYFEGRDLSRLLLDRDAWPA